MVLRTTGVYIHKCSSKTITGTVRSGHFCVSPISIALSMRFVGIQPISQKASLLCS